MWFVYILRCKDNSLYVGSSSALRQRIKEHNSGEGALYTRNRRPVKLAYFEQYDSLKSARQRENRLKGGLVRRKKT